MPTHLSSSVWNQPSATIPSVSCAPAPLISVVHTLCPSVRPPTLIPISSLWHLHSFPFLSFCPVWAMKQDCHLWSWYNFPCRHRPPMCLAMESSVFPWVSSKSSSQQCNEARLPSTARWDFASLLTVMACCNKDRATLPSAVAADSINQIIPVQQQLLVLLQLLLFLFFIVPFPFLIGQTIRYLDLVD